MPGQDLQAALGLDSPETRNFLLSWEDMAVDRYIQREDMTRRRRFGRFTLDRADSRLERLPHRPFFQSKQINQLSGGIQRVFEPMRDDVATSPVLGRIVRFVIDCLPIDPKAPMDVNAHQIRVIAGDQSASPTPEGLHQDGHDFVAQVLIRRHNITGAESTVLNETRDETLVRQTLETSFDLVVVDDHRTWHGVSAFERAGPGPAFRDMLIIDFNRIAASNSHAAPEADAVPA